MLFSRAMSFQEPSTGVQTGYSSDILHNIVTRSCLLLYWTTKHFICKRSFLCSCFLGGVPEHNPDSSQISLVNQLYRLLRVDSFFLPAVWQQVRTEEKQDNKCGQSVTLRNQIVAGASQTHDVAPWTLKGGDVEGTSALSSLWDFFFFWLILFPNCFPLPAPHISSAVNLTVVCPLFTSSHEKWGLN